MAPKLNNRVGIAKDTAANAGIDAKKKVQGTAPKVNMNKTQVVPTYQDMDVSLVDPPTVKSRIPIKAKVRTLNPQPGSQGSLCDLIL